MAKIIRKDDSILLLIDFQEKLLPAMKLAEEIEEKTIRLIKGCKAFNLPILATQQYTKGLGDTVASIKKALEETLPNNDAMVKIFEKTSFSCLGEHNFLQTLKSLDRRSIIVAGIESHVCVEQTVLDLLEMGYSVFVIADGISSRNNNDRKYAQRRMSEAGAVITTYEAALFEMLGNAKSPLFKTISKIVK